MLQPAAAALLAFAAFDAGVYFASAVRSQDGLARRAEFAVAAGTGAGVLIALALGGRLGDAAVVALLWARAGWDALHVGEGNVLELDLPRDYALASLLVKLVASALFILFLFTPAGA